MIAAHRAELDAAEARVHAEEHLLEHGGDSPLRAGVGRDGGPVGRAARRRNAGAGVAAAEPPARLGRPPCSPGDTSGVPAPGNPAEVRARLTVACAGGIPSVGV